MILPMWGQAWLFLSTVLLGAAVGVLYDIFRVLRRVVRHSVAVVQIEDIIFWVTATVFVFYFMLVQNYGEIRPFSLIGITCGAIIYFLTLSKVILFFLSKVIQLALRAISWPFRFIAKLIIPPANKFLRRVKVYGRIQKKKWRARRKKV